jgi:hypothetical protein
MEYLQKAIASDSHAIRVWWENWRDGAKSRISAAGAKRVKTRAKDGKWATCKTLDLITKDFAAMSGQRWPKISALPSKKRVYTLCCIRSIAQCLAYLSRKTRENELNVTKEEIK